jgi:hypothetical protein
MSKSEKIKVTESETILSGCYDEMDVSDFIKKVNSLSSQGYTRIEIDKEYGYYDSEPTCKLVAIRTRLETDKEYSDRLLKQDEFKNQRRMQYEKLKREFET